MLPLVTIQHEISRSGSCVIEVMIPANPILSPLSQSHCVISSSDKVNDLNEKASCHQIFYHQTLITKPPLGYVACIRSKVQSSTKTELVLYQTERVL